MFTFLLFINVSTFPHSSFVHPVNWSFSIHDLTILSYPSSTFHHIQSPNSYQIVTNFFLIQYKFTSGILNNSINLTFVRETPRLAALQLLGTSFSKYYESEVNLSTYPQNTMRPNHKLEIIHCLLYCIFKKNVAINQNILATYASCTLITCNFYS